MMFEKIARLNKCEMENQLWNISLSIHEYDCEEQKKFITFISDHNNDIEASILLRTITNMLHWYYYGMDKETKALYIDILLSLGNKDDIAIGDLFEILGIVIKGCNPNNYSVLASFITNNYLRCMKDYSSVISLCNCIRYAYPELDKNSRISMCNILNSIKDYYKETDIMPSIEFTIKSLEDK